MIIFSVEQANICTRQNIEAIIKATKLLKENGTYHTLMGVYKGIEEVSFITNQVELGQQLARDFNQESYLERGHYGYWYLIETKSGQIIDTFKTLKEVTKEQAKQIDNYSILNGKYYVGSKY